MERGERHDGIGDLGIYLSYYGSTSRGVQMLVHGPLMLLGLPCQGGDVQLIPGLPRASAQCAGPSLRRSDLAADIKLNCRSHKLDSLEQVQY